jgi:uncharacterized protein YjlB
MTHQVETLRLPAGSTMPNNPDLPVLVYRNVGPLAAGAFEALFSRSGWEGLWRNGIYDFDHYHTEGHEALAVAAGWAEVQLGGPEGRPVRLEAGDVVVLPAGTGHRRIEASPDFLVVGAYPPGQAGDICRDPPDDATRQKIADLPLPATDPVEGGGEGALRRHWLRA